MEKSGVYISYVTLERAAYSVTRIAKSISKVGLYLFSCVAANLFNKLTYLLYRLVFQNL